MMLQQHAVVALSLSCAAVHRPAAVTRTAAHAASMLFDGLAKQWADDDERTYLAEPLDVSGVTLPEGCTGASDVFMIFHGAGGPDRETDDLQARVKAQDAAANFDRSVCLVDWRPWFSTGARRNLNSYHGQEVGRSIGRLLADASPELQTLHVVGTSAGAWVSLHFQHCSASHVVQRARYTLRPFESRLRLAGE